MSTPEDHLRQLDARAAGAATDLHARAGNRPVPTFDPDLAAVRPLPAARPSGRGRLLAVAAVLLVIAAVAGVLITQIGTDDDDTDPAKVITTEPRPFLASSLPDGFALSGAGEITADQPPVDDGIEVSGSGAVTLYGPSDDDPRLGIAVFPSWSAESGNGQRDQPVEVDLDGRTAYRWDDMGLGKRALVVREGEGAVAVVTSTADGDWLDRVGAEVTVDEAGNVDLHGADLPDGWHELGQVPELLSLISPMMATLDPEAVGSYAFYQRGGAETVSASDTGEASSSGSGSGDDLSWQEAPDQLLPEDAATLLVSSSPGDALGLHAGAVVADTVTGTTVRGHDAVLTTTLPTGPDAPATRTVAWLERPGELVRVSGTGVSEPDLLATAEGVTTASATEWNDLLERSQLGEFDPANEDDPDRVVVVRDRFADGSAYVLTATPSDDPDFPAPSIDLVVAPAAGADRWTTTSDSASGESFESVPPGEQVFLATTSVGTGSRSFGAALVGSQVARVEIRDEDGTVVGEPEIVEGGGYRGLVAEVDGTAIVVAFDADGNEVGRTQFGMELGPNGGSGDTTETTVIIDGGSESFSGTGTEISPDSGGN